MASRSAGSAKTSLGEWALEPIARETPAKGERVVAYYLCQISADLMTVSRSGDVGDVLAAAGVAADSGTGNKGAPSGRGESANETAGEPNRSIQVRGRVRK